MLSNVLIVYSRLFNLQKCSRAQDCAGHAQGTRRLRHVPPPCTQDDGLTEASRVELLPLLALS